MTSFSVIFAIVLILNIILTIRSSDYYKKWVTQGGVVISISDPEDGSGSGGESSETQKKHTQLLQRYLLVYLLATMSDWLQGPYVYALYADYGFEQKEIAQLFVAGFGSSMIFGSFIGGMADWGGRRAFVILFSIVYAASCVTKHFNSYSILMLGRLLGGVATSLLFSVFDAWLIRSHADADLPKSYLSKSFSWAAYGNSVIAILAGLVANNVAGWAPMTKSGGETSTGSLHFGGYLNPFDLALVALICCGTCAYFLWSENYGETTNDHDRTTDKNDDDCPSNKNKNNWYDGLRHALTATLRNRDIFLCGIISSLFEGSMYIFVFMWTPLLRAFAKARGDDNVDLPFGIIFATFMVCCMAGSSCFSILVKDHPVEKLGVVVFGIGSFAMGLVAMAPNETISFLGMNIFEMCVGMYFPIMGTMKGGIVPEDKRAAIYNLYRIPLNFIVLFSLLTGLSPFISFTINALMLGTATFLQLILMKRRLESSGGSLEHRVTKLEDELIQEETLSLKANAEAV